MSERDWAEAPFVRIYSSVANDEKFKDIYANDRHFSWYVKLLIGAKAYYPSAAPIPRSAPQPSIDALEAAGIIAVVNKDLYTICALAKEMADVNEAQRAGGVARAATADRGERGEFLPAKGEDRADIDAFLMVRHRMPTAAQRRVLDDVLQRHDVNGPKWAADIILANPGDPIGAVIAADREYREERKAGAVAQEQESKERKRRGIQDPMLQEFARTLREREEAEGIERVTA